jgi:hypothetical protein
MSFLATFRIIAFLASLCGLAAVVPVGAAAQTATAKKREDSQAATAGATVNKPAVTLTVAPSGSGRHVSGRWATMAVNGLNRSHVDQVETAAVMIGEDKNLQFARRLWIPARSVRQSWLPVQIPAGLFMGQMQIPLTSIHLKQGESSEQYQADVTGMTISERSLLLSWEGSRTGVFLQSRESDESTERVDALSAAIYAARDAEVNSRQDLGLVHFQGWLLPPLAEVFDPLDQIVVANDRILSDTVAVTRLRAWLQEGGRIWIMCDQVDPEVVGSLLGDAMCYSVVDRVELNEYHMQRVDPTSLGKETVTQQWESETPAELVRVMVDVDDVSGRIDGWPTCFWKQVGHGEVMFTTLGAGGWLHGGEATPALRALASRFFVSRWEAPAPTEKMAAFLDDEIGYRIPGRRAVATVLGLHLLAVLGIGIWLARRRCLEQLAVLIPLAAMLGSVTLLGIGKSRTSAVPSTIATGQLARVSDESSQVQVRSIAAIYSRLSRTLEIEASPETTTLLPDLQSGGEVKRIEWDDSGNSRWLFVNQPPGVVRHVDSQSHVALPQPWSFSGRFGEGGFHGRLSGLDPGRCEDAVIVATAAPPLAVRFEGAPPAGSLSRLEDVLSPDQYVDDKWISDVQQDRQDLLRRLMSGESPWVGRQPMLVVWTDPIDAGTSFDADLVRRGSALVSIPIRLERVPSGTDFQVPATFVRLELYLGSGGTSSFFNPETGKWLEQPNRPNETQLRCVPPPVLLPCELTRATVLIKINAPSRTLEIKGWDGDRFVTLQQRENPNGLLRFEIDRADVLRLDEGGGWLLAIAVSPTAEERQAAAAVAVAVAPDQGADDAISLQPEPSRSTWQIDYVHVNLEGTSR